MNRLLAIIPVALSLGGCTSLEPAPAAPPAPKLAFSGSLDGDLVLYNDPAPAPVHPAVELARIAGRVALGVAGYHYAADVATGIAGTIADAGGSGGVSSTVERTQTVHAVRPEVVQAPGATQVVRPEVVRPEVVTTPSPQVVNPQVVRPEVIQPAAAP